MLDGLSHTRYKNVFLVEYSRPPVAEPYLSPQFLERSLSISLHLEVILRIHKSIPISVFFIAIVGLLGLGRAMGQGGQASISGVVTDISGAAIPNAEVSLKNNDTGVVRTIAVQSSGDYRFAAVAPGHSQASYSMNA